MLYLMVLGWNIRDGTPLWRDLHCVDRSVVSFINTHTSSMIFILIAVLTCVRDVYVVKVISLLSALICIDICFLFTANVFLFEILLTIFCCFKLNAVFMHLLILLGYFICNKSKLMTYVCLITTVSIIINYSCSG